MKIGLIDLDSKIPNLALMKLSGWHKKQGHKTNLTSPLFANQYDKIFVSKIFDWTEIPILPACAEIGGGGFDGSIKLDPEIERSMPDYSLYNCDYAIGYTSRGCDRNCPFCIVPKNEGKFHPVADIAQFWTDQKRIMFLDNSANTDAKHFDRIMDQIISHQIEYSFIQGLDIRILTDQQAMKLKIARRWKRLHFSWDNIKEENEIRKGIEILKKYKLNYESIFYVLIGYDSTPDEDLYRIDILSGLNVHPFVMPFNKEDRYQKDFARWVNHKAVFKSTSWANYSVKIKGKKDNWREFRDGGLFRRDNAANGAGANGRKLQDRNVGASKSDGE